MLLINQKINFPFIFICFFMWTGKYFFFFFFFFFKYSFIFLSANSVVLSRNLISSIISCAFLCLFPERKKDKTSRLNNINFTNFFQFLPLWVKSNFTLVISMNKIICYYCNFTIANSKYLFFKSKIWNVFSLFAVFCLFVFLKVKINLIC